MVTDLEVKGANRKIFPDSETLTSNSIKDMVKNTALGRDSMLKGKQDPGSKTIIGLIIFQKVLQFFQIILHLSIQHLMLACFLLSL